jgi:methyl-accepting chemotaxis protein
MQDALSGVLLALTIVIGVGVLVIIVVLAALAKIALDARKRIHKLLDQYETTIAPHLGHLGPIVASTHALIEELSPKLKHITSNLVEVSDILRSEAQHITVSVSDMVERTHQQAARVDHIVSSTLNGIGHATAAVQEGIAAPLRHLSGVFEGLRAGFGSLRRKRPHSNGARATVIVRKVEQDPY